MLNHAKERAFELVVLRDESRLGGDTYRTGLVIQDLADAGVGIVHYISDELVSIDSAVDKFLVAARNFASELEREQISSRSYGYAIVDKQYVVHEPEAVIVR
jgi:site-specific DNA recombinase